MNVLEQLSTLAALPATLGAIFPNKPALVLNARSLTYAEFDQQTNDVARALLRDGLNPGDRIALLGRDSLEGLSVLFGVARAKGVCVPINWRLAAEEITYIIKHSGPKALFVDHESLPLVTTVLERLGAPLPLIVLGDAPTDHTTFSHWVATDSGPLPPFEYSPDDVVVQMYTSGTTGYPKGVQLAHRTFFAIARSLREHDDPWFGWKNDDVQMICLPSFHIGGLWCISRGLALGNTNIVVRAFDASTVLAAVPKHRVSILLMVPAMMQVVLREPDCATTDFSSLRVMIYGGSPISTTLLGQAMTTFCRDFVQLYGLTETGNVAVSLRPADHHEGGEQRLRAAGRPLPGVTVRILDLDGNEVPEGVVGEIVIRSPACMVGYWNAPEATAKTLVDGWIITGDAGYADAQGFIYLCDRIKDMIIVAGENVYPAEIEEVIRKHPDVVDTAVIGVPDDIWGEAIKAFVVLRPDANVRAAEIIRMTRSKLADFKAPKSVEFVNQLPRNASGKLLKNKLREPYWQGRTRRIN
jgi:acyl-CoA synthetase (AMP-forming)/AMP-acid ligase II